MSTTQFALACVPLTAWKGSAPTGGAILIGGVGHHGIFRFRIKPENTPVWTAPRLYGAASIEFAGRQFKDSGEVMDGQPLYVLVPA